MISFREQITQKENLSQFFLMEVDEEIADQLESNPSSGRI